MVNKFPAKKGKDYAFINVRLAMVPITHKVSCDVSKDRYVSTIACSTFGISSLTPPLGVVTLWNARFVFSSRTSLRNEV